MTASETYYRDHWERIEPHLVPMYEEFFRWQPNMEALIKGADIVPGVRVIDYGCGPGFLTLELAKRVGPGGHVAGCDLNAAFLAGARARAETEGLAERIDWHHTADDRIPITDRGADRVLCKNVLEYVPDLAATLAEFHRVLKPEGIAHVIDSDWSALIIEPIGPERVSRLLAAARPAYRDPMAGRHLYGAMRAAGFRTVKVEIFARPDTRGQLLAVAITLVTYAKQFGRMPADEADGIITDCQAAIDAGTYMLFLPQFLVTAVK
ncbi:MAG: methyltransferase domain-containing protein [Candidatus Binatia bacterium]